MRTATGSSCGGSSPPPADGNADDVEMIGNDNIHWQALWPDKMFFKILNHDSKGSLISNEHEYRTQVRVKNETKGAKLIVRHSHQRSKILGKVWRT
jgi:hypothetical protein